MSKTILNTRPLMKYPPQCSDTLTNNIIMQRVTEPGTSPFKMTTTPEHRQKNETKQPEYWVYKGGSQTTSTISYPIQPSSKYPKATMKIQSWLCDKIEIANRFRTQISIEAETEKAYRIKFTTGIPEEHWIPKSVCEIVQRTGARILVA